MKRLFFAISKYFPYLRWLITKDEQGRIILMLYRLRGGKVLYSRIFVISDLLTDKSHGYGTRLDRQKEINYHMLKNQTQK